MNLTDNILLDEELIKENETLQKIKFIIDNYKKLEQKVSDLQEDNYDLINTIMEHEDKIIGYQEDIGILREDNKLLNDILNNIKSYSERCLKENHSEEALSCFDYIKRLSDYENN